MACEKHTCSVSGCEGQVKAKGLCSRHYLRMLRHGSPLGGGYSRGDVQAWLIENVGHDSGISCLEWPFSYLRSGYGSVRYEGGTRNAHSVMCEMAHGKKTSKYHEAAHSCGNRRCCNPRHLRWATRSENLMDKVDHGTDNRGSKNPHSKLTERQVREIKAMLGEVKQVDIAKRFNVHRTTISAINRGKMWGWLT